MSYKNEMLQKTRAELASIAIEYGIDPGRKNKTILADEIIRFETGVAPEAPIDPAPVKQEKPKDEGPLSLVRFTGQHGTFQVGKYTFQAENPFLAVPERVANHVYKTWPKLFRPATPAEVTSFYS